jgi:hypothetical protein
MSVRRVIALARFGPDDAYQRQNPDDEHRSDYDRQSEIHGTHPYAVVPPNAHHWHAEVDKILTTHSAASNQQKALSNAPRNFQLTHGLDSVAIGAMSTGGALEGAVKRVLNVRKSKHDIQSNSNSFEQIGMQTC